MGNMFEFLSYIDLLYLYFLTAHYDCLFNDNNFCNFTLFEPTVGDARWQLETGSTDTLNTGPNAAQEGEEEHKKLHLKCVFIFL